MGNFLMVACQAAKGKQTVKENFFKKILKDISCKKKIRSIGEEVRKVRLYESIDADLIYLPFTASELLGLKSSLLGEIGKRIGRLCQENEIRECILPKELYQFEALCENLKELFPEKYLYKCIFTNIIELILRRRNLDAGGTDAAIVKGGANELFLSVLRLLSSRAKFITVVSENPDEIADETGRIYEETGLAIRITSDFRNGMKNSGIIINFGDLKLFSRAKIPRNAVILNYSQEDISKLSIENPVINGINVALPKYVAAQLGEDLSRQFEGLRIAEAILRYRVNSGKPLDFSDYKALDKISAAFKNDGYRIRGFIGRRSIFRLEDS